MGDMGKMPTGTRKIAKQRDAPISRVQPRADYVLEAARLVDARRRVLEFRCQLAGQADRRIVEGFATGADRVETRFPVWSRRYAPQIKVSSGLLSRALGVWLFGEERTAL